MLIPSALSTAGIHFEMSGNGNVAPVPTSELALGFAAAGSVRSGDRRDSRNHDDDESEHKSSFHGASSILVLPLPASFHLLRKSNCSVSAAGICGVVSVKIR